MNVDVIEEPPPSKRVRIMEDEGVEQMLPTPLDSEETTATGEAVQKLVLWCVHV